MTPPLTRLLHGLRELMPLLVLGASAGLVAFSAQAQGFAAFISPPRFEVQAQPGQPLREILEIQHMGREKGNYRVYTNDWTMDANNSVAFSNELAPESCRPWVAIERREIAIEPSARYRYRFEITPPPGTPPRECRFAIMIEGLEAAQVQGQLSFPVAGRIGVIVYAIVGSAAPELAMVGTRVAVVNGKPTALVEVRNSGNAHGRMDGVLNGTDASGQRFELTPADLPVLPGETRSIALAPVREEGQPELTIQFPIKVKGSLEWGKNRLPLDANFSP